MAKDKEFWAVDPDTGVKTLDYVIRPSIKRNNLGPITLDQVVKVEVRRNTDLMVRLRYVMKKPLPANRSMLLSVMKFEVEELASNTISLHSGEVLIVKDVEVDEKNPDTGEYTLDHIRRPRNAMLYPIGPYVVGDECKVEYLVDDVAIEIMNYTPSSALSVDKSLFATLVVDFVEVS